MAASEKKMGKLQKKVSVLEAQKAVRPAILMPTQREEEKARKAGAR